MSQFIKNKHNTEIVNLEKVTKISPIILKIGPEAVLKTKYHIYFTYNAMCNEDEMCTTWKFKEKSDCLSVLDSLVITEI